MSGLVCLRMWPRTPLTNLADESLPNSLPSSTASSMMTLGGVCEVLSSWIASLRIDKSTRFIWEIGHSGADSEMALSICGRSLTTDLISSDGSMPFRKLNANRDLRSV